MVTVLLTWNTIIAQLVTKWCQCSPNPERGRGKEGELCLAHNNNLPDNLGLVLLAPWSEPKLDVADLVHHVH